MKILLTRENIKDLNDTGATTLDRVIIYLDETDYVEPSTMYTARIGITRTTLVRLLKQEVTIDDITLKLQK